MKPRTPIQKEIMHLLKRHKQRIRRKDRKACNAAEPK